MTFALDRAYLPELRHSWGWYVALGIALILLGAACIAVAGLVTLTTVLVFGWLLMIGGAMLTIHAFTVRHWSGFFVSLLIGILNLITGLLLVAYPAVGAMSVTLLLAAFFLVGGLFRIIAALAFPFAHRLWLALSGIIAVGLGAMVWSQWPLVSAFLIGTFIGIDLMLYGLSLTMFGTMARNLREEPAA